MLLTFAARALMFNCLRQGSATYGLGSGPPSNFMRSAYFYAHSSGPRLFFVIEIHQQSRRNVVSFGHRH